MSWQGKLTLLMYLYGWLAGGTVLEMGGEVWMRGSGRGEVGGGERWEGGPLAC